MRVDHPALAVAEHEGEAVTVTHELESAEKHVQAVENRHEPGYRRPGHLDSGAP